MTLPGLEEYRTQAEAARSALDPTAFLLADHEWLRFLLAELRPRAADSAQAAELHAIIEALEPLLDRHIRQEEEAYFPVVDRHVRELTEGATEDMYGEHDAIRVALSDLLGALARGREATTAYAAFTRSLLVHFENEEELIFGEAAERLSKAERRAILEKFDSLT